MTMAFREPYTIDAKLTYRIWVDCRHGYSWPEKGSGVYTPYFSV